MGSTASRRMAVLSAIVQDYVASREPVGSKALVERHGLKVSPATVRNDMAALEDQGYITQPHTSAGRIPTDRGYRAFVDAISQVKPLSAAERRAITGLIEGATDFSEVAQRTVRLLAQLTHNVAVVQYPALSRSVVRHIEVVSLGERRVLIVLITSTGHVDQRSIELPEPVDEASLQRVRTTILAACAGRRCAEARAVLAALSTPAGEITPGHPLPVIAQAVSEALSRQTEERLEVAGAANLARSDVDFRGTIFPVLDALEEQVVLLRLFAEMDADETVRIGEENEDQALAETSIVASAYGGSGEDAVASLAVIGPTRMDYPATIASVRAVARYLSHFLNQSD